MAENNPFNFNNEEKEDSDGNSYPIPVPELKLNVHTLLNQVLNTKDSTKVGFLSDTELGQPSYTVRGSKEMSRISRIVCKDPMLEEWFNSEAEDTLATSLSKNGKFLNVAITQKRTIADETRNSSGSNKGWFKKDDKKGEEE